MLVKASCIKVSISLLFSDRWSDSQNLNALRMGNEFPKSAKNSFVLNAFEKLRETTLSNVHSS